MYIIHQCIYMFTVCTYIIHFCMYIKHTCIYMFIHIIFNAFVLLRWTQEELKKVIAMLHNPEFDSKDIDPDLHQQMHNAVLDGRIKCFNMREAGDKDGDQDLNLWARELEDVLREIMEDPVFKGNQNFKFEMDLDEVGKRLFGGEANAFQIGQLR